MKRRVYMLLIIVLGAVLQQTLPELALFGGMKPPILASLALHYALRKGSPDLWFAVFFAALLQDGLEMGSFGPALLTFPLMGMAALRIRNEIFSDGIVTQLILGAAMGLFTTFSALLLYSVTDQRSLPASAAFLRILGSLPLGMICLPAVSRTVNQLESLIPKRKGFGWQ